MGHRFIVRTQHHAVQCGRASVLWRRSRPASRRQRQQKCHSQEQCASHFFNLFGVSFLERRKEASHTSAFPARPRFCLECKTCSPGSSAATVECAPPSTCLLGQVSRRVWASTVTAFRSMYKQGSVLERRFNL